MMRRRSRVKNKSIQYILNKNVALQLAHQRLAHFNEIYQFHYAKVGVRNQKTCWGSCSRKGNLSFNYKIALMPGHLADYIIVHELCHVGELNHSKRFWSLIAQTMPEYKMLKKELAFWRRSVSMVK